MTGLPAITLWQPWASLVACGAKRWETRDWNTSYRGPLLIHAAKVERPEEAALVALPAIHDALWPALGFEQRPMPTSVRERLPRGAIVGRVEVVDSCPIGGPYSFRTGIVEGDEGDHPGQAVVVAHPPLHGEDLWTLVHDADGRQHDITDQLTFGIWDPGRYAWQLENIAPTTERCPWCLGAGKISGTVPGVPAEVCTKLSPCPVCWPRNAAGEREFWADGRSGRCDPIPARGMPGIWRWQP